MPGKITPQEITAFLKDYKKYLQSKFYFVQRQKNLQTLTQLGITIRHAKEIIAGLSYCDYCSGPLDDRDRPGRRLWEFGYSISGKNIYIKLSDDFSSGYAKCISFHIAEFELEFPCKLGGNYGE